MTDKNITFLCRVTAQSPERQAWGAQGVFLSKRHVLTNWHAVKGAKDLIFTNVMGWHSAMKPAREGGQHFFDPNLDVALVELKIPIGLSAAEPPRGLPKCKDAFADAVLKTMFDNKPAVHDLCYTMNAASGSRHDSQRMQFNAHIQIIPGYSGSPVFSEDGRSLLSIVTSCVPLEQEIVMGLRQKFQGMVNAKAITLAPSIPFLAIRPDLLAEWYRKVERELKVA